MDKEQARSHFLEILNDTRIELKALKEDNETLKHLINQMVTVDESFETPYTVREVVQMLFNWANRDER